jgi:DNA-binding XRE family transcriptional regulator
MKKELQRNTDASMTPVFDDRLKNKNVKILKVRGLNVIKDNSIALMKKETEQNLKKAFGAKVRQLRQEKGMSQEQLALLCDLDRTYVGGVERGERNISLINIHKIARALGVPVKELFNA